MVSLELIRLANNQLPASEARYNIAPPLFYCIFFYLFFANGAEQHEFEMWFVPTRSTLVRWVQTTPRIQNKRTQNT